MAEKTAAFYHKEEGLPGFRDQKKCIAVLLFLCYDRKRKICKLPDCIDPGLAENQRRHIMEKRYFENVRKNLGFGFMRLPMTGEEVDIPQTKSMVDMFMENGFNYFDTAHGYLDGKSELAIGQCLASRYPRESFVLTNKLSGNYFNTQEDIRPLFQQQLEACRVAYFDFYLMHALNAKSFARYKELHAFETAMELLGEGKIRHLGISFHDKAEVLDQILTEYPQIEVVQIQFNYVDFEDKKVESRKCYEVCRKHNKPVIVMEPVKGGSLVNLPETAQKLFDQLQGGSNASYAIRFAAGFEGMMMVLSGMSSLEQMADNISFMKDFQPLTSAELEAVEKVRTIFRNQSIIPCTGCRYCTEVCPQEIPIPEIFAQLNARRQDKPADISSLPGGKPQDCVRCGGCEAICPQNLNIRELLMVAAEELA